MSETATIRVSLETQELLAQEARTRGVSITALIDEIALELHREAVFRSERQATLADEHNPEGQREQRDWDGPLADGLN